MAKIRIVGAIASKDGITLYLEDATEENLPTTSWRTKAILDEVLERLARHEVVEIDLDTYSIEARVEKDTNGVVRFAKKTKSFVKGLFGLKDAPAADTETVVIVPPQPVDPAPVNKTPVGTPVEPVVAKDYKPEPETELVAIVTDSKTGEETIIPGVEALEKHVEAAVIADNVIGLQRFMERLATVQKKRAHTAQELLRFMERGDLPIAEDGTIVAYKVLKTKDKVNPDLFVDCHTAKVEQRVGSKVMQDESLIDQNRRNECSTGLHIARRGYLGGFNGDVITIVKVAPEDVVAVPPNEPNKMRAAAYHIVGRIPEDLHAVLRDNKPMTGNVAAAKLLADVIAGRHIGVTEHVRITSAYGSSFTTTPISNGGEVRAGESGVVQFARALDAPIDGLKPKDIRQAIDKVQQEAASKDVKAAAASGDLSAAISEPTPAPAPKPAKAEKPVKTVDTGVQAEKPVPQKHTDALRLHGEGKSNRAIEAELHICRKTLKKLFDKHGLKPNG